MSPSLDLLDSPAVVHKVIGVLKYGDRVDVMKTEGTWAKVQAGDGGQGWVITQELMPSKTYEDGQKLLHQLSSRQVQAAGHAVLAANLRLEPGRDGPELGMLAQDQTLDVFDRRMIARKTAGSGAGQPASSTPVPDVWYLVRSGSRAGWVLGRLVTLDIPQGISQYAANYNTVAWFVLNTVRDGDSNVPQYLVADREGSVGFDFTHIRVFTWWVKQHHYVTSYVQSGLKGVFPIRTENLGNTPYFRLRLVDDKGNKFQSVYGLFNTIVRPMGRVEGWESNAMPERKHRR
ncbi:MAG TPA: SH3 domain-containing protein [Terriglobia bacterium]|nr:SH3 domain-containing protein [Terriglobia bacterium]